MAPVYIDGRLWSFKGDAIVAEFIAMLNDYVDRRYAARPEDVVETTV